MKTISAFLFLFASFTAGAQITLENTYPGAANGNERLSVIHLSSSGYKYMYVDTGHVLIYNLNHSLFRSISVPPQTNVYWPTFNIYFVSEELFDTNPNNVEYLISYESNSGNDWHIIVYNDSGNIIFSRDSMLFGSVLGPGVGTGGVAYTSAGVKMILYHQSNGNAEVWSLPGTLPCTECSSGTMTGIMQHGSGNTNDSQQELPDPFPNPASTTTTVGYKLPPGTNSGQLVFYDITGREVKRFTVTNMFDSLLVSVSDLAAGTYTYSVITDKGTIPGKQIVVVK